MAPVLQTVSVGKIYLDPENPRHESLPDEATIIRHLVSKELIRPLARDIADAGSLNPLELIALIRHPKVASGFVVVEGNRRICALKLLADPDKADTEKDKRYFTGLAKNQTTRVSKIQAMVFESRGHARRWFALRHEGEQEGVGTKAWNADQKARFSLRNSGRNPNAQAVLIIDFARRHNLLRPEDLEQLSTTTITRYLSNPVFRHALGLHDGNSLQIDVPDTEFERALVRFLTDSLSPDSSGVSSRTNAADRKTYANRLHHDGVAATSFGSGTHEARAGVLSGVVPSGSTVVNAPPSAVPPPPDATRDNRSPDKRKHVVPSTFSARVKDKTLKRLYDELKKIDAREFSFSSVYLMRTVLEKSTILYLKSKKVSPKGEFHHKLGQLVVALKADGMSDKELKFLRTISSAVDDQHSADSIGHFVHGGSIPSPAYVFRYWDNMEHVFQRVLNAV